MENWLEELEILCSWRWNFEEWRLEIEFNSFGVLPFLSISIKLVVFRKSVGRGRRSRGPE